MALSTTADSLHPPLAVIQPTAFCNLDCTYCYVEGRDDTTRMSTEVLAKIARHATSHYAELDVVFHSGEPLTVGIGWFTKAVETFRASAQHSGTRLRFGVQTNGVLVNDTWCEFLSEHKFLVGISIDGPAWMHDAVRVGKRGQSSHGQVERGLRLLQAHGLEPTILAVVGPDAMQHPAEFYNYFRSVGAHRIGLNAEDATADHTSSLRDISDIRAAFTAFMAELVRLVRADGEDGLSIREVTQQARAVLAASRGMPEPANDVQEPFRVISYDIAGNFSTFCPELITAPARIRAKYVLGNAATDSIARVQHGSRQLAALVEDIQTGRKACRRECDYFSVCGGGKPSAKEFEHHTTDATTTLSCQLRVMAVTDAVLASLPLNDDKAERSA